VPEKSTVTMMSVYKATDSTGAGCERNFLSLSYFSSPFFIFIKKITVPEKAPLL